jgi:hypothetical protein
MCSTAVEPHESYMWLFLSLLEICVCSPGALEKLFVASMQPRTAIGSSRAALGKQLHNTAKVSGENCENSMSL